jgi:transcriptional regulator with XRE-family HTH domain
MDACIQSRTRSPLLRGAVVRHPDLVDRDALARALVTARNRLQPADVGLPATRSRRVPGLRREEVARLAGISVNYLTRLEQARGPRRSPQVLGALARSLRLSDPETVQLFVLAGTEPPRPDRVDPIVRARTSQLMDRLSDLPVLVVDATGKMLAWNELALALIGDVSGLATVVRNVLRMRFLGGGSSRVVYDSPDEEEAAAIEMVADLRAAAARYPDDPDVQSLVVELRGSERFRTLWQSARAPRASRKTIMHPAVGRLSLHCDVLLIPDNDRRMIVYSAEPGTRDADALDLLRVLGTQQLEARS